MNEHLSWTADLDFSQRQVRLALDRVQSGETARPDPGAGADGQARP
jgi:hypothetical protein